MKFENCAKYIYKKLEEVYPSNKLIGKKVILFGYEAVSKTLAHYFDNIGIVNYDIIDLVKYGQFWKEQAILKPSDILPKIDSNSVVLIINNYEQAIKELQKYSNILKKEIINFSDIRMDNMPNNLTLPKNTRKIDLKECQKELLEMLDDFHNFCEENKIVYYLAYGTLLGAVRHNGFIPWDDDLDIYMPAKDYFKFCQLYKGSERWEFDSIFNKDMPTFSISTLSKIKSKTTFVEYHSFPIRAFEGIGLDIFPICGYPTKEFEQIEFEKQFRLLEDIWKDKVVIPYGTEEYSSEIHRNIFDDMNKLISKYDYETSDYVGAAYFGPDSFVGDDTRKLGRKWFKSAIKMDFESRHYNVPIEYDAVLKRLFGDYMVLPPEEKRISHHVKGRVGIRKIIK